MAKVASLMKTDLIIAAPDETVASVSRKMQDTGVGAVLIVENGALTGLFSERDLVRRVVAAGADPKTLRVGDVATKPVVSVGPETHVKECVELFRREGFRHLPVVSGGRPVGLVGLRDLLVFVTDVLERVVDSDAYRQATSTGADPYDHFGGSYAR